MLFDKLGQIFRAAIGDREKVKLAQGEMETEDNVLVLDMLKRRSRLDPAKMEWFSEQQTVSLAKAHSNTEIWNRGGRGLFITKMDGTPTTTLMRFNNIAGSIYEVHPGYIKGAFQKIYLTNAAEAGKTLKFVVGYRNFGEFMMLDPATNAGLVTLAQTLMNATSPKDLNDLYGALLKLVSTTPIIYNIEMADPDTEYSQVLPSNCHAFRAVLADGASFRFAFVEGKVETPTAPYFTQPANIPYEEKDLTLTGKTFYFADDIGTKIMQMVCWTG